MNFKKDNMFTIFYKLSVIILITWIKQKNLFNVLIVLLLFYYFIVISLTGGVHRDGGEVRRGGGDECVRQLGRPPSRQRLC